MRGKKRKGEGGWVGEKGWEEGRLVAILVGIFDKSRVQCDIIQEFTTFNRFFSEFYEKRHIAANVTINSVLNTCLVDMYREYH